MIALRPKMDGRLLVFMLSFPASSGWTGVWCPWDHQDFQPHGASSQGGEISKRKMQQPHLRAGAAPPAPS